MRGTLPPCPAYAFMACMGITSTILKCTSLDIMCKILVKVSLSIQNWLGIKFSESFTFLLDLIVAEIQ